MLITKLYRISSKSTSSFALYVIWKKARQGKHLLSLTGLYVPLYPRPFCQLQHGKAVALPLCPCYQQRIALPDTHCSPDFLGDDHASQVIPLCQVGAKKFYKLSEKPLISMTLGFPDGATMHLRGFDRLCYFRSKFDRFAPK